MKRGVIFVLSCAVVLSFAFQTEASNSRFKKKMNCKFMNSKGKVVKHRPNMKLRLNRSAKNFEGNFVVHGRNSRGKGVTVDVLIRKKNSRRTKYSLVVSLFDGITESIFVEKFRTHYMKLALPGIGRLQCMGPGKKKYRQPSRNQFAMSDRQIEDMRDRRYIDTEYRDPRKFLHKKDGGSTTGGGEEEDPRHRHRRNIL